MKRIFVLSILFLSCLNLQAAKDSEKYEPVIIPDKTDPWEEKQIEAPEAHTFYAEAGFGYLFSKAYDLEKVQNDFTNAGIGDLSAITGFLNFRLEFGYANLFENFDVFGIIGYAFSPNKSGSGDISYGLGPIASTVDFGMYSVPLLLGVKYVFYKTKWIRLGGKTDFGVSIVRGSIDVTPDEAGSLDITSSGLNYGGTALSADVLVFVETKLHRNLNLEFDLGYSVTSLSNVKILDSYGNFATEFSPGKRLMIHDSQTGQSEAFKIRMNGLAFWLSVKTLF